MIGSIGLCIFHQIGASSVRQILRIALPVILHIRRMGYIPCGKRQITLVRKGMVSSQSGKIAVRIINMFESICPLNVTGNAFCIIIGHIISKIEGLQIQVEGRFGIPGFHGSTYHSEFGSNRMLRIGIPIDIRSHFLTVQMYVQNARYAFVA